MVQLIKDKNGNPIGWKMEPTTEEERQIATTIRDLQFFGIEDTAIAYNGMETIDPEKEKSYENFKSVSWLQRKHHK